MCLFLFKKLNINNDTNVKHSIVTSENVETCCKIYFFLYMAHTEHINSMLASISMHVEWNQRSQQLH